MSENVIIIGAGTSYDAGIPLMNGFVDRMWEFSVRERNGDVMLSEEDKKIFANAMKVRFELDGYHGRANFDDRNIEDILSLLSFNIIGGRQSDRDKFSWIIRAIARTIDISCQVKHTGKQERILDGDAFYRTFWKGLFKLSATTNSMPFIINFNYDLVLEKSLFQTLNNNIYSAEKGFYNRDGIIIDYHYKRIEPFYYKIKHVRFNDISNVHDAKGTVLDPCQKINLERPLNINLLKLHGSLNFPHRKKAGTIVTPCDSQKEPLLLPPIFNKLSSNSYQEVWAKALRVLRNAKNLIIVGYSMPKTDIYMNYFFKAGLGPNVNLNKVYVFNPVLFEDSNENVVMRERYSECFAPQLKSRLIFEPKNGSNIPNGTFKHFVSKISDSSGIFF
jgi:hypothetical protein